MTEKKYCPPISLLSCIFLVGFAIWAGWYFGMYQYYIEREWKEATCTVTDIARYRSYDHANYHD